MPSRLRRRAVRRLVRRHRRQPGRPGIRPVAAATALVMVCAATIQLGVIARTPISTTSAGPATVPQGPTGQVARVVAGGGGLVIGAVRWTMARTATLPGGAATCATGILTRESASVAPLGLACTDGVSTAAHEAWVRLHEVESREARILRADRVRTRAEKRAAEKRAAERAQARQAAKRKAARERAEKRAAEKRAAERRAARKAAANAAGKAQRGGASWRTAPIVTWYGPGFYGNRTACGVRYTRQIIGVAHRSLPCGTLVEFKWHGITAVAPVIDRGPFASSAYVFDFSAAMACEVFKPRGVDNACFTRYDVQYRVVGRVNLRDYVRRE